MKRILAFTLCLILVFSLCACGVETDETGETPNFTEAPAVTLPDGSTVYSKEPFVEFPQTGEYKETALLTNVPGQGVPLLLDMRSDGTIDYIFADIDDRADLTNCADSGIQYYTIAPDGTATKQDADWMEGVDNYMATTLEATQDPDGKWRLLFTADEGTILILAQYHNIRQYLTPSAAVKTSGKFQYTTLFKVVDNSLTIVPIDRTVEIGSLTVDLSAEYLSSVELANGQIIISKRSALEYMDTENCYAITYNMDGTVVSSQRVFREGHSGGNYTDETGLMVHSIDYNIGNRPSTRPPQVYRDGVISYYSAVSDLPDVDDRNLYYFQKYAFNIKASATGGGKDFCCWFDQAGQSVLIRYTYAPEGKIEPEVLTVWSFHYSYEIDAAVVQWNHTHSSPIFRYESTSIWEMQNNENLTIDDILTRLNLQLLNNQGPDVLILDGLDVDDYLDFLAPLDRVNTDGIYPGILDRFTVGDDLLAIPARVYPYLLGRTAEDTEDITSLRQFADVLEANTQIKGMDEDGRPVTDSKTHLYYIEDYHQLFRLWYPAWQDAIWEGNQLNKEVFIEFLTQTTRLSDLYALDDVKSLIQYEPYFFYDYENERPDSEKNMIAFTPYLRVTDSDLVVGNYFPKSYALAAPGHMGLYSYWCYANESDQNQLPNPHYLSGIPGPDGTGAMIPSSITGVRAGGNEEAGQEFIQLLLSRENQLGEGYYYPAASHGYPVVWKYAEELLEKTEAFMHQEYAIINDYRELMNSLRAVVLDEYLYDAAIAAAKSCYRTENRLTPEEAAEALYEATRIYLAEKR